MDKSRHDLKLYPDEALLIVVDVQEKLLPVIRHRERLIERLAALAKGFRAIGGPVIVTEQYRKGLGATDSVVRKACGDAEIIEKTTFSCVGEELFRKALIASGRRQIVVAGIETHICCLQTVLDLIAEGFTVHLVEDACSTRLAGTHAVGIARAQGAGATVTVVESVLFEMMERCDGETFKKVLPFVRELA